ncbi:GNAT family N-acetyltransferase [Streptomyces sp. NPDC021093]|uniref:GNAT family N-acetyltransferase n=1 Tax=Streptomyces sp. NPDC021093 TaxID=3365112 RepID=UPI0037B5ED31
MSSPTPEVPRIKAFLAAFDRRQASRTVEFPGGFAVFDERYPESHGNNHLVVDGIPDDPLALPALADEILGHLPHRMICVHDEATAAACAPPLALAGYRHSVDLIMLHTGQEPADSLARQAGPIDLDAFREPLARRWRGFLPDVHDEVVRQLVDRREARFRGADIVHFIGSRTETGEVASWADLYADPVTGIAQIEDLVTSEEHLRRGHADAVVAAALRLAAEAGCDTRFLTADGDDWPRHWYERRGFTVIGRSHCFERDD